MPKIYLDQSLDPERKKTLKILSPLKKEAVLGGGTALALQLGHRKSFDFDLFLDRPINNPFKNNVFNLFGNNIKRIINDSADELTFFALNNIKITFLFFPFPPLFPLVPTPFLPLFHPRDLASNKAYSLGRRAAYRDYVDLYFLLKNYSLEEIIKDSQKRFGGAFSAKLFLEQLVYFDDLDSFEVDFLGQEKPSFEEIRKFLEQKVEKYLSFINSNN